MNLPYTADFSGTGALSSDWSVLSPYTILARASGKLAGTGAALLRGLVAARPQIDLTWTLGTGQLNVLACVSADLTRLFILTIASSGANLSYSTTGFDGSWTTLYQDATARGSGTLALAWSFDGKQHTIKIGAAAAFTVSSAAAPVAQTGIVGFVMAGNSTVSAYQVSLSGQMPDRIPQLTYRLYLQRSGAAGYTDLGNLQKVKTNHQHKTVDWVQKSGGTSRVASTQIGRIDWGWECQLDEFGSMALELLYYGAPTVTTQSIATNVTWPASPAQVKFTTLKSPHEGWTSYASIGAGVEGTDFLVLPDAGWVQILTDMTGGAGFQCTYNAPAQSRAAYAAITETVLPCNFLLMGFDDNDPAPREIYSGTGAFNVTATDDQDGEAITKYTLALQATGAVSAKRRL